ncbi:MAG TPA: hypothetical protein VG916_02650, partial [Gemmatimonadaceae bacterium]|nr:hypothetical protein [Gemmatimonadaceae bacterium]
DVSTYELPTLTRSYRWVRPMIDGGMARGIPDKRVRERTITLYIDKTPFKRALGIPDEDRIRVFLVGRAGRVYWRAVGRWTAEAGDSLRAVLDAVAASSPVVMLDVRPARGDVRRAVTPAPHLEEPRASATRHHTARV